MNSSHSASNQSGKMGIVDSHYDWILMRQPLDKP